MNTKERIVEEALTLFSEYGYQGTSVKNIADAVGIKDSSLYKHFKSKKEIFDTIVKEMSVRMERMSKEYGLPDEHDMDAAVSYQTELFAEMTARGVFHGKDPKAMAVNFYAPIFFLLNRYDQQPDKVKEALEALRKQVMEFSRLYK